jgi:hypothetical protein
MYVLSFRDPLRLSEHGGDRPIAAQPLFKFPTGRGLPPMLNLKNHSIQDCIEKQDWTALHAAVHSLPPAEIAEILITVRKPEERVNRPPEPGR